MLTTECRLHKKRRLNNSVTAIESMPEDSDAVRISAELGSDQPSFAGSTKHALSSGNLSQSRAAIAKTGVVYLSRIPPRLSPTKIRQLLSPYGSKLLRIFLAPESTADVSRRIKSGGSKKRQFIEGWVEFEDKRVAKRVAEMLNAQRMGGRKGDFWYDDLWCMKYLPKFKWHHLTEQIAYQNASRVEKLRNEIAQEKRENAAFIRNSERSKMIGNIQRKKQANARENSGAGNGSKLRRQFSQKSVICGSEGGQSTSVLGKVFE